MLQTEDYVHAILKQGLDLDGACKTGIMGLDAYCGGDTIVTSHGLQIKRGSSLLLVLPTHPRT